MIITNDSAINEIAGGLLCDWFSPSLSLFQNRAINEIAGACESDSTISQVVGKRHCSLNFDKIANNPNEPGMLANTKTLIKILLQRFFELMERVSPPVFHEGPLNSLTRQSSILAEQACQLLSIGGRVVAYGAIVADSEGTTYKVIIDEVADWHTELFCVIGMTFGDIDVGHTVEWP
ncbi:hypothetical protein FRX31_028632, partial [Thalictrum thalictroides]